MGFNHRLSVVTAAQPDVARRPPDFLVIFMSTCVIPDYKKSPRQVPIQTKLSRLYNLLTTLSAVEEHTCFASVKVDHIHARRRIRRVRN
jgi:hypothetical protein